jgi:hypothetical protein
MCSVWEIIPSCVILNHFWWFEILKHTCFIVTDVLCFMQVSFAFNLFDLHFVLWAWIFVLFQASFIFDLDVLYHSRYLCVMCCVCVDNIDCKHGHRRTWELYWFQFYGIHTNLHVYSLSKILCWNVIKNYKYKYK